MNLRSLLLAFVSSTVWLAAQHGESFSADWAKAKERAAASSKDLLVLFTGSDWCAPCIRLTEEVFRTEAFLQRATASYELVVVDSPRQEGLLAAATVAQNEVLKADFAVNSWPVVFLCDADGRPYARTEDYRPGGPEAYLQHLSDLQANKAKRDAFLVRAEAAKGAERAKLLDAALACCGRLPTAPLAAWIDALLAADPTDESRLAAKWRTMRATDGLELALPVLGKAGKWRELVAEIDRYLAEQEPEAWMRQKALYWKGMGHFQLGEAESAKASFEASVLLGTESEFGRRSQGMLERAARTKG